MTSDIWKVKEKSVCGEPEGSRIVLPCGGIRTGDNRGIDLCQAYLILRRSSITTPMICTGVDTISAEE